MAITAYNNSTNFIKRFFTPAQSLLGKNLKTIINGSAPITTEMYQFFKQQLPNCEIFQAYGLTETFGGACSTSYGLHDPEILSIGSPFINTTFRIRSVPDMCYLTSNDPPTGELEIKSDAVFKEYYKKQDITQKAFTDDGYFVTGDIVKINIDGSVSIIDRRSNLIKLAQGEFVAVETVEQSLIGGKILQVFAHGVSTDNFIVAIVVVDKEHSSISSDAMLKEITQILQSKGFPSFSIPKAVFVETIPFSEQNDLLTPSMKLRRANLKKHYATQIEQMRNKINNQLN